MGTARKPVVSEADTPEQASSHDRWFRAKVQESLADPRPPISHAEVKSRTAELIAKAHAREKAEKARR